MPNQNLEAARGVMLDKHLQQRGIDSERVLDAMRSVPRERFVPPDQQSMAYDDCALAIDCNQTISQPYIVALMTQALELTGSEVVLEVGTGSGYQTAILSRLAHRVITVERYEHLSDVARTRLSELQCRNVEYVVADGRDGVLREAPFDRIVITAAADSCPIRLWEQLAEGGILVAPFGSRKDQLLQAIRKRDGKPLIQPLTPCRFVPLLEGVVPIAS